VTGLRKTFVFQEARAGTAHRFAAHNAAGMVSAQEGLMALAAPDGPPRALEGKWR